MNRTVEFPGETFSGSSTVDTVCLLTLAALVSLWGLTGGPGLSDHEAIVGQGARQIRQGGDWIVPQVNDAPFIRKPPLALWLATASSYLVDPASLTPPVSPFAARLPSALAAILTVVLVYALGRSMFGHATGVICGGSMATCGGGMYFSHNAQVEMVLTCLCTACFAFFWWGTEGGRKRRLHLLLFYVAFAAAMMAKAPLPLAMVGLPLAVWWFVTVPVARMAVPDRGAAGRDGRWALFRQQGRRLRDLWLIPGVVVFLLLFALWPLYVLLKVDHAVDLWKLEFVDRYTGELGGRARPLWYYLPIALILVFPYSLSLPEAVLAPFLRRFREQRKGLLFAFTWAAVPMAFLSTAAFKRPHYLAATVPALILLLGPAFHRLFLATRSFSARNLRTAAVALVVFLGVATVVADAVIGRQYGAALWTYRVGMPLLLAGVVAATIAFLRQQRVASLLMLFASSALSFAWAWNALGQSHALQRQPDAMVAELKARSIGDGDRITWVVGRPDARIMYYLGRQIEPLFDPLEVSARREGRRSVPLEMIIEGETRMKRRLGSATEEYFIVDADYWDRFRGSTGGVAREVFRVCGEDHLDTDDDWVVITNAWNTGEEEDQVLPVARPAAPWCAPPGSADAPRPDRRKIT